MVLSVGALAILGFHFLDDSDLKQSNLLLHPAFGDAGRIDAAAESEFACEGLLLLAGGEAVSHGGHPDRCCCAMEP